MIIKTLSFAYKKGLPEFSSVQAMVEVEVGEDEDLEKAWDEIRQMCINQATLDASWVDHDDEETKAKKQSAQDYRKQLKI